MPGDEQEDVCSCITAWKRERTSSFFCSLWLLWLGLGAPPKKLRMSAGILCVYYKGNSTANRMNACAVEMYLHRQWAGAVVVHIHG